MRPPYQVDDNLQVWTLEEYDESDQLPALSTRLGSEPTYLQDGRYELNTPRVLRYAAFARSDLITDMASRRGSLVPDSVCLQVALRTFIHRCGLIARQELSVLPYMPHFLHSQSSESQACRKGIPRSDAATAAAVICCEI